MSNLEFIVIRKKRVVMTLSLAADPLSPNKFLFVGHIRYPQPPVVVCVEMVLKTCDRLAFCERDDPRHMGELTAVLFSQVAVRFTSGA